jgi:GNAT superfamily N-acetyltransferase
MPQKKIDLDADCHIVKVSRENAIDAFDCGNDDLNEFFIADAPKYHQQLLGETYFFVEKETQRVVCAYTLSNDGIKTFDLPNSRKKKVREAVPREKHMKSFPASLIGRLGVSKEFSNQGLGSQLMEFVKASCLYEEGNRCRFLIVDAYNQPEVIQYYLKNKFIFLFSTEDQEKEYFGIDHSNAIKTRFMYFDLLDLGRQLFG